MSEYALRLANGQDTAARVRAGDALHLAPNGTVRARGGLRPDGGGVVTVVSGQMQVQVTPFSCWVDASPAGQVGYPFVCDATKTLTIDPGDATQVRVDTVAVVIKENAFDGTGTTSAVLQIVKGTPGAGAPAMPTSACIPLRDISVPAGASAGSGGLSSGALSTDRRVFTVGAGGVIPCLSTARPSNPYAGMEIFETDTKLCKVYDGALWAPIGPGAWVDDLVTATNANIQVTGATRAVIPSGGPFAVTVPTGRTLEVEFRVPIVDCPAGTGVQAFVVIAGQTLDACYLSNSNGASFAMPVNLRGLYVGTGVAVNVQVEAVKVGGGTPSFQGQSLAPIRIRHRIT